MITALTDIRAAPRTAETLKVPVVPQQQRIAILLRAQRAVARLQTARKLIHPAVVLQRRITALWILMMMATMRFMRTMITTGIANSMKKTLGERIREQRILMQMTQEELAEELCVKKSTISMYENDKVDIKGSILIELSGVLHTSPNYLLGMEEYEEDLLEIITVYKNLKGSKTKQIALEQMKLLATMSSEL